VPEPSVGSALQVPPPGVARRSRYRGRDRAAACCRAGHQQRADGWRTRGNAVPRPV